MIYRNNKWFTLIELTIWIAMSAIVMTSIWNFGLEYYKSSIELNKTHNEFSDISLWLNSLQKIIFENAKYFTFNTEVLNSWQCRWFITDWPWLWNLCHYKFGFVVENESFEEEQYYVELVDCNLGNIIWKQLVYKKWSDVIPLLWSCIYASENSSIEHKIEIIDDNIKEKIIRYSIITWNWNYKQTFFVH